MARKEHPIFLTEEELSTVIEALRLGWMDSANDPEGDEEYIEWAAKAKKLEKKLKDLREAIR